MYSELCIVFAVEYIFLQCNGWEFNSFNKREDFLSNNCTMKDKILPCTQTSTSVQTFQQKPPIISKGNSKESLKTEFMTSPLIISKGNFKEILKIEIMKKTKPNFLKGTEIMTKTSNYFKRNFQNKSRIPKKSFSSEIQHCRRGFLPDKLSK